MRWVALLTMVVVALLGAACSKGFTGGSDISSEPTPGPSLTSVAEAGGVEVEGTWLTDEHMDGVDGDLTAYPLDEFVLVKVQFTTHSGDLSRIDMVQAAVLRQGGSEVQPADWISLSDNSHHRAGILVFPRLVAEGPAEITIDLGDEEVALEWEGVPTT